MFYNVLCAHSQRVSTLYTRKPCEKIKKLAQGSHCIGIATQKRCTYVCLSAGDQIRLLLTAWFVFRFFVYVK